MPDEPLYLAYYLVKTQVSSTTTTPPYFDGDGNYIKDDELRRQVLLHETPLIVVSLGQREQKQAHKLLLRAIGDCRIEQDERKRWRVVRTNDSTQYTTVLFYLVQDSGLPDTVRNSIITSAYSTDDFFAAYCRKISYPHSRLPPLVYSSSDSQTQQSDNSSPDSQTQQHDNPSSESQTLQPKNRRSRRQIRRSSNEVKSHWPKNPASASQEMIEAYHAALETLAKRYGDSGDDSERLWRYERIVPYAIDWFLEYLSNDVSMLLEDRKRRIVENADRHWPPENHPSEWVTRTDLATELGHPSHVLANWASNKARGASSQTSDNPQDSGDSNPGYDWSGWDRYNRYWRSKTKGHTVYYFDETKYGLDEAE